MDKNQQRQIAGALIQPAVKQRWDEDEQGRGPVPREPVQQAKQDRGNQIGTPAGSQAHHKVGAEKPLLREGRQQ